MFMLRFYADKTDQKLEIYVDKDVKITKEGLTIFIAQVESCGCILKSVTCDQAGGNRHSIYIRTVSS